MFGKIWTFVGPSFLGLTLLLTHQLSRCHEATKCYKIYNVKYVRPSQLYQMKSNSPFKLVNRNPPPPREKLWPKQVPPDFFIVITKGRGLNPECVLTLTKFQNFSANTCCSVRPSNSKCRDFEQSFEERSSGCLEEDCYLNLRLEIKVHHQQKKVFL